jgi:hypothetical protein
MAAGILEQLAPLADKAAALGGKQRGDAIAASDWNAMVDVLRGLLDAVNSQETALTSTFDQRYAAKEHAHVGEVSLEWLDASLRASVGGLGSSITLRAAVDDATKTVASFAQQIATLQAHVDAQQRAFDQFALDGLDAKSALSGLDQRFAALETLRTNVTQLTAQLNGLGPNIDAVLSLRKSLTDATGKPVDVAKMQQDVAGLQTGLQNLNGLDGQPVRLRDVLVRQQNVEQALGVDGANGLDTRISAAVTAATAPLSDTLGKQIDTRIADFKTANDASLTAFRSDVTAQVATARDGLAKDAAAQIATTAQQLSTATAQQITAANTALRADVLDAANKAVQSAVAGVPAQVQSGVAALRDDLQKSLSASLSTSLAASVNAQLAATTGPLADRLTKIESDAGALRTAIPGQIQTAVTAAAADIGTQVDAKVAAARASITDALGGTVTSTVSSALAQQLAPAVDGALQARAPVIAAQVDAAVKASVQTIPTTVTREVQAQIASLALDAKFQQQQTAIAAQLTTQVNQQIAAIDAKQTTALANVNKTLSGRIDTLSTSRPVPAPVTVTKVGGSPTIAQP